MAISVIPVKGVQDGGINGFYRSFPALPEPFLQDFSFPSKKVLIAVSSQFDRAVKDNSKSVSFSTPVKLNKAKRIRLPYFDRCRC
jgi:hypothetical protein